MAAQVGGELRLLAGGCTRRGDIGRAEARKEVLRQSLDDIFVRDEADLGDRREGRPAEARDAEEAMRKGLAILAGEIAGSSSAKMKPPDTAHSPG